MQEKIQKDDGIVKLFEQLNQRLCSRPPVPSTLHSGNLVKRGGVMEFASGSASSLKGPLRRSGNIRYRSLRTSQGVMTVEEIGQ